MPRSQPTILFEPTDASFHDVATPVGLTIERRMLPLIRTSRNHGLNVASPQVVSDARVAVAFVPSDALRSLPMAAVGAADLGRGEHRFGEQGLVPLPGGRQHLQGDSLAV